MSCAFISVSFIRLTLTLALNLAFIKKEIRLLFQIKIKIMIKTVSKFNFRPDAIAPPRRRKPIFLLVILVKQVFNPGGEVAGKALFPYRVLEKYVHGDKGIQLF